MRSRPPVSARRIACLIATIGLSLLVHAQTQLQVGYTILTANAGSSVPVASALFSYTNRVAFWSVKPIAGIPHQKGGITAALEYLTESAKGLVASVR